MIAIGWNKIKNLRKIHVKAALEALHKKAYPRETKGAQAINIGQAWAFCKEMEKGDIILISGGMATIPARATLLSAGNTTGKIALRISL